MKSREKMISNEHHFKSYDFNSYTTLTTERQMWCICR